MAHNFLFLHLFVAFFRFVANLFTSYVSYTDLFSNQFLASDKGFGKCFFPPFLYPTKTQRVDFGKCFSPPFLYATKSQSVDFICCSLNIFV
jgi:hypothetical protein